jgi:pilus assembly protein CpaB
MERAVRRARRGGLARSKRGVSRRARAIALLGLSAICAGLAASLVNGYARDVRAQVGPLVPTLVARKQIPRGHLFTPASAPAYLSQRRVPARFAPPHSFRFVREVIGLRVLGPVPTGTYVGAAHLGTAAGRSSRSANISAGGGRLVEVQVVGSGGLEDVLRPGVRVDVLVTSERGPGPPRTYLALQRIELVDFGDRAVGSTVESADAGRGEAVATLRVSLRQAILLTAAQNFARELRLVPRTVGDGRQMSPIAVSAQDLQP